MSKLPLSTVESPQPRQGLHGPCLVCNTNQVEEFINLGETALANNFLSKEELAKPEPKHPLRVGFCHGCGHVQLTHIVPPEAMFRRYLYMSSASQTLTKHFQDLSEVIVRRLGLRPKDLVMDIGCNDGSLLAGFKGQGVRTLGVDPAENLAALSADSGVERYVGFFNAAVAPTIAARWGKANAITLTNTFPHIPALHDFLKGITIALAPGGTMVMEMHYLLDLVEKHAFDTIYHEHVSYWALRPMMRLLETHGLQVVDVERLPFHHGQLRVWIRRKGETSPEPSVDALLAQEKAAGLDKFETYREFARHAADIRASLRRMLDELHAKGKRVVGYGAPAKASTFLSFLGLKTNDLAYICDKSPLKQGRFVPGAHIPVVRHERLLSDQPDYVILFAWNFADEIMAEQSEFRRRGGKFIIPVPSVTVA